MDRPGAVDVLRLADGWMLRADESQWMLCRRRSEKTGGWVPISFVATTKDILARCMREAGCVPDDTGTAAFAALSSNFRAWRAEYVMAALPAVTVHPVVAQEVAA